MKSPPRVEVCCLLAAGIEQVFWHQAGIEQVTGVELCARWGTSTSVIFIHSGTDVTDVTVLFIDIPNENT